MDTLQCMRTLISVIQTGSFTGAAEKLNISTQLVSKYVAHLEQQLGVRLLNRTTRRIHLTEAGQEYLAKAEPIVDSIDALEQTIGNSQQQVRGTLRISAPVSFAVNHLPRLVATFQNAHPDVEVDLQLNDRKVDIIEEGFDIALRIGRLKDSSLIAKKLAAIDTVLCASPAYLAQHPSIATIDDLRGHAYLQYSLLDAAAPDPAHQTLLRYGRRSGALSSNNGDVLTQLAIEGAGIALQPTFICGDAIRSGALNVVLPQHRPESIGLYAVYAHRQWMPAKTRAFIEMADGFFGSPPYWDEGLTRKT